MSSLPDTSDETWTPATRLSQASSTTLPRRPPRSRRLVMSG
ncbi:hypothetical protein JHW43_004490 [Diplocarpon mali]|nr:hypothetical protein JHW43_004490 [Diplocarpon mali]